MYTVVITAGRNVGDKPMGPARWREMLLQIIDDLQYADAKILQRPVTGQKSSTQVGEWDGQTEESATFVAIVPCKDSLFILRSWLAFNAARFDQEAFGFIVVEGDDHLVYAKQG